MNGKQVSALLVRWISKRAEQRDHEEKNGVKKKRGRGAGIDWASLRVVADMLTEKIWSVVYKKIWNCLPKIRMKGTKHLGKEIKIENSATLNCGEE